MTAAKHLPYLTPPWYFLVVASIAHLRVAIVSFELAAPVPDVATDAVDLDNMIVLILALLCFLCFPPTSVPILQLHFLATWPDPKRNHVLSGERNSHSGNHEINNSAKVSLSSFR